MYDVTSYMGKSPTPNVNRPLDVHVTEYESLLI